MSSKLRSRLDALERATRPVGKIHYVYTPRAEDGSPAQWRQAERKARAAYERDHGPIGRHDHIEFMHVIDPDPEV